MVRLACRRVRGSRGQDTLSAAQVAINKILDGADPQTELTKAAKAIDADIADNDGYPPFGK